MEFESDGSDDGAKYFYAKSEDKNGLQSPCDYIANYTLDTIQGTPSVLFVSEGPLLDFSSVEVGAKASRVIKVMVTGELAIEEVNVHQFKSQGFYFKGGFPGEGGTCKAKFTNDCTFVISFSPTERKSYEDTFKVSYKSGALQTTVQRKLAGVGESTPN